MRWRVRRDSRPAKAATAPSERRGLALRRAGRLAIIPAMNAAIPHDTEVLVLQHLREDGPGHLGGQLIARAFGGRVRTLDTPEIGWLPMRHDGSAAARDWLGDAPDATVYQWHHDSFTELPPGAQLIAASAACPHQAFVLRQHLAMQFHIEITERKVEDWIAVPGTGYAPVCAAHPATVQTPAVMRGQTQRHLATSQALADRIYGRWRERWRR